MDECSQMAYQAVQRNDGIEAGRTHPYEGAIKAECIKADAALSAFRNEELTRNFGDAQYVLSQIAGGMGAQLSEFSAIAIERQLSAVIAQNTPSTARIKSQLEERERDLRIFKGANDIQRPVEKPSASSTIYYALTFAILETLANVAFLRESFSPINAFFVALTLGCLNVGGNVWFGNRYREKNHINPIRAASGARNAIYSGLLTLGVAALVAAARVWAQSIVDGGFIIESIVLLAIGITLGIFSFHKGYSMDDPYPGYGALARSVDELQEEIRLITERHAAFCDELRKKVEAAHNDAKHRIRSAAASLSTALPEISRALQEWTHQREQIDDAFAQQQKIFKAIVVANSKVGTDYPQEIEKLPISSQLELRRSEIEKILAKSETISSEVEKLITQIDDSLSSFHGWLKSDSARELLRWPT